MRSRSSALADGISHSMTDTWPPLISVIAGAALFAAPGGPRYLSPPFPRNHEFQSGPDVVDGADLDIDEAERKPAIANHRFRHISRDTRRFLRPRHPDHAVR